MFNLVTRFLRETGWTAWDTLQARAKGGVEWWFFRGGERQPAAVGKLCGEHAAIESARRECAALRSLGPVAGRLGAPQVLFHAEEASRFAYLRTVAPGTPLRDEVSSSDRKAIDGQFKVAEGWLNVFQSLVPARGTAAEAIRPTLDKLSGRLPDLLLRAGHEALEPLAGAPAVAVHGDFWSRNVLVSGGRTCVIDWSALHHGSPLEDLFTFSVGIVFRRDPDPARSAERIWDVFFGSSHVAGSSRRAMLQRLAQLEVSPALLRPLFLASLFHRLTQDEFTDNSAMHAFAARYAAAGAPAPWAGNSL